MAAKKPASAQKQPRARTQKAKSTGKKRKDSRPGRKTTEQAPPRTKRTTAKRKGREAVSESKEEAELQHEFFSQQQLFRAAIEDSAKLLRQAAESALHSIREQTHQVKSDSGQPTIPTAPEDPLKPLTDQFVEEAYKRAREMFDEIGPVGAQSGQSATQAPLPTAARPADRLAEDALATSALLMNQATQYLNMAIDSVMKEMDRRLSAQASSSVPHPATPPRHKRP